MNSAFRNTASVFALVMLVLGIWLMTSASLSYAELGEAHPFFLEKLPLERPDWWPNEEEIRTALAPEMRLRPERRR